MSTIVEILDETLTDMRDNLVESYEEWGATMCDMLDGLNDDSPAEYHADVQSLIHQLSDTGTMIHHLNDTRSMITKGRQEVNAETLTSIIDKLADYRITTKQNQRAFTEMR